MMPVQHKLSQNEIDQILFKIMRQGRRNSLALNAALNIARSGKKHGGVPLPGPNDAPVTKFHIGFIPSPVAGRTDHLPMHVPSGAYVIPAAEVSALAEGNSLGGAKILDRLFGDDEKFYEHNPNVKGTAIVAAGGEYVISPRKVQEIGEGNIDDGHAILDGYVNKIRKKTIQTLQKLPGPKRD